MFKTKLKQVLTYLAIPTVIGLWLIGVGEKPDSFGQSVITTFQQAKDAL